MNLPHPAIIGNVVAVFFVSAAVADVTHEALNAAFDQPVWADDNLWDDADAEVATRLRWPQESQTSFDASYRLYPDSETTALGTRPFSLVLFGSAGTVSQISMVFANKGDVDQLAEIEPEMTRTQIDREITRAARDFGKFITRDENLIAERLTELLGEPVTDRFGQGRNTAERVRRWDWNGHSILLAAPRGEYVAVRIIPTSVADGEATERVSRADLREKLGQRVERRDNGDVILRDMPMVDQGPKGYCVPATWERVMRYVGIPADMYVLAMAGATSVGGGTSVSRMMFGVNDIIRRNGRRSVTEGGRITTRGIARMIDNGLPLMWQMVVVDEVNSSVTDRSRQRQSVTDWDVYVEELKPWRLAARRIRKSDGGGHVCMIIGYNEKTKEVAISDSWGPAYAERWITEEEANAITSGQIYVISW